ncbi:response regulator transcription factor [Dyadobacter sp. CY345]|uniref:LuxR C-terminal-related transcriptional regulator n=1 Tax=Dyadobacter sp. CY345 TaxID=2909335 RepID=UPI001F391065|nr:response regulator transcription factor [Dyadobacter sp. CY345]MCF2447359.1 response regulator transcription factor [Dyadobacter sp. CY345]
MHNVLIIEDHELVAYAIANIVKDRFPDSSIKLAHTFIKGTNLINSGFITDLIVLDMEIPGGESYAMVDRLRSIQPNARILIFTGHEEKKHALNFLRAGANGFLPKNSPMDQIDNAIQQVLGDKTYMTEWVQQQVAESFFSKTSGRTTTEPAALSPRETEVLDLLMDGKWIKEIALELNLKLTTVSTHKTRIFEKMKVTNIIDLYKKVRLY